MSLFILRTL
jgi:hypothetical protein